MFKLIRRSSGNNGFLGSVSSNLTSEFSLGQHKLHVLMRLGWASHRATWGVVYLLTASFLFETFGAQVLKSAQILCKFCFLKLVDIL